MLQPFRRVTMSLFETDHKVCVCLYVCVLEREIEREREWGRETVCMFLSISFFVISVLGWYVLAVFAGSGEQSRGDRWMVISSLGRGI